MQGVYEAFGIHISNESDVSRSYIYGHKEYIDNILKDISTPASLEAAQAHRDQSSLRKWINSKPRLFNIMCSSTAHFTSYSLGFSLHFMLLKQLIILFSIIAGASAFPLYLHYKGNYFKESQVQSQLDFFTVANEYGQRLTDNEIDSNKIEDNYFKVWLTDACCSGFFLLSIFVYFVYAYINIMIELKKNHRVSDYTIEIKGLPKTGVTEEEVKRFFVKFGEVVEVYLGRRYGNVLFLHTERAKTSEEIRIRESLNQFNETDPEKDKRLKKLKKNRAKFDKKILKKGAMKRHEDLEIKRAYITFNRKEDKIRCLKEMKKKNCCGCRVFKKEFMFREMHKLTVFQSTEPTDILWENLEVGKCSRCLRVLFSLLLTILFLLMSASMIYYVKTQQSKLPQESECLEFFPNEKMGDSKSSLQTLCYCQNLSSSELFKQSKDCYIYIQYISQAWGFKFLSSFGIILVNFFLKSIMRKISSFERPKSKSEIQRRIFKKVLLVMFINTAILTYIVNLSIPGVSKYVFAGKYDDFSRDWYLSVGSLLLSLMIISLGSPHLIYLMLAYPIGACKRRCCYKSKKSQFELNILFTGPEFDLATRSAQILNVVFTSYLYSGGIPLLNCTCFIFLVILYYTDKFLVLRHFRKPPYSNQELYISILKILPICVILHCAVSLYTFGNPNIFDISYKTNKTAGEILKDTIGSRVSKPSGVINVFIIISAVLLIVFLNFLNIFCSFCMKRLIKYSNNEVLFNTIREQITKTGLDSYNIKNNPDYAMIINEIDDSIKLNEESGKFAMLGSHMNMIVKDEKVDLQKNLSDFGESSIDEPKTSPRRISDISCSSEPDLSRDENHKLSLKFPKLKEEEVSLRLEENSDDNDEHD